MKMCSKVDQTATLSPQDNYFPEVLENCKEICYNVENAKVKWRKPDEEVRIMAVTKTVPPEKVNFAVAQGFKLLGENRVQEFLSKKDAYDKSAQVQFIGHLQTNKVKYIINDVTLIQSVDNLKLAQEISRLAVKNNKTMNVLVEINIGDEATKSGVSADMAEELVRQTAQLIKNVGIEIDHMTKNSPKILLVEGCTFSVRGYGKFKLLSVDGTTKKDRIHITLNKFV